MAEQSRDLYIAGIAFLQWFLAFLLVMASIVVAAFISYRYFGISLSEPIPNAKEPEVLVTLLISVIVVITPVIYVSQILSLIIVKPLISCAEFEKMLVENFKHRIFESTRRLMRKTVGCPQDAA